MGPTVVGTNYKSRCKSSMIKFNAIVADVLLSNSIGMQSLPPSQVQFTRESGPVQPPLVVFLMNPLSLGRLLWRSVGRHVGLAPAEEWRCGDRWNADVFEALDGGINTRLMRYRAGRLEWERDTRDQMHEFTCYCLELLLAVPPLPHLPSQFPASFTKALEVKRGWLQGGCSESELEEVADQVSDDIQNEFPSNWCFGVNASVAGNQVARWALDRDEPWIATARCARNLAMFHGYRLACAAAGCKLGESGPVVHEVRGTPEGEAVAVRGVLCPHMEDGELERTAIQTFDDAVTTWNRRLSEDFIRRITPLAANDSPDSK